MLECANGLVSIEAADVVALGGDVTAVMLDHCITEASGAVSCTGSVAVPEEPGTPPREAACTLIDDPQTSCLIAFTVLPHPPINCPAPPAVALRSADAAQMAAPFGSGAVVCDPASPADIDAAAFPQALQEDATISVLCTSSETPNTCSFDVVLAARAPSSPLSLIEHWSRCVYAGFSHLSAVVLDLVLYRNTDRCAMGALCAAHVLECTMASIAAEVAEDMSRDATAIATDFGAITASSGPFSCSGDIAVPPLTSTTDLESTITCSLLEDATTTCEFPLFVGPHPELDCPAPPADAIRESDAIDALFTGADAVTCTPASPADIPSGAFPGPLEDNKPFAVSCNSTETPHTCTFDVVLLARALLACVLACAAGCTYCIPVLQGVSQVAPSGGGSNCMVCVQHMCLIAKTARSVRTRRWQLVTT